MIFAAGDDMQQLKCFSEVIAIAPTRAYMLARARNTTVSGIEVHLVGVVDIPENTHPLKHMNVLAVIGNTGEIVEVARC